MLICWNVFQLLISILISTSQSSIFLVSFSNSEDTLRQEASLPSSPGPGKTNSTRHGSVRERAHPVPLPGQWYLLPVIIVSQPVLSKLQRQVAINELSQLRRVLPLHDTRQRKPRGDLYFGYLKDRCSWFGRKWLSRVYCRHLWCFWYDAYDWTRTVTRVEKWILYRHHDWSTCVKMAANNIVPMNIQQI